MDQQHQKEALSRVGDNVDEAPVGQIDTARFMAAMKRMNEQEQKVAAEEVARKAKLAAVNVDTKDVDVLVNEFELEKSAADLVLRENGGDIKATLVKLITSEN